jgi:hypothetical protein
MGEPMAYRFLSGMPPQPNGDTTPYLPAGHPSLPRTTREPLDQYPYLRGLALDWLDRYDDSALDEVDAFLTSHPDDVDAEQAGHDLAVYLCDWVVANSDTARWHLNPGRGMCFVELRNGNWLDPYRWVVLCVAGRQPATRRFVEKAREFGAIPPA